ncbi:unnamed protein product [Sphagnum troendelagicum]
MEGKWRRLEAVGPCQRSRQMQDNSVKSLFSLKLEILVHVIGSESRLLRKFGHLHHQLIRKQLPAEVARSKSRLTGGVKVRIVLYGNSACSYILMALTGSYGAGIP